MSLRGLLVLLLLLLVAGATLRRVGTSSGPTAPSAGEPPLAPAFTEDAVREVDIACGGALVTLRRDDGRRWHVARPFEAEADPRRVHEVVAAIQDARVHKAIAGPEADPAAFGLAPAACTVRLESAVAPGLTLRIGRASPVGSERYAAVDDSRVALTDGSLYGTIAREPESFREKRLIPFEAGEIARIVVLRPGERLAIALGDGGCRLEAPVIDAGATTACESLARAVTAVELSGPFATGPPAGANPERLIALEVTPKGASAPTKAFIAAAGRDGRRLAWRDGSPRVGLLGESAVSQIVRPADSYRDPRIVALLPSELRRLTVWRGGTVLGLERASEAAPWRASVGSSVVPLDAARADAAVDALRDLRASGFLAPAPTTPATATIAAFGERGELVRMTFGPIVPEAGHPAGPVWVTTPTRPGVVFEVEASRIAGLPKDAADLRPAAKPASPAAAGS